MRAMMLAALLSLVAASPSSAADPTGPQHVSASATQPALTIELSAADAPLTCTVA